jgi:hypothetical protein
MSEITEKLWEMYGKQNPARLERKWRNISKAERREKENNPTGLPEGRVNYYSHRLHVLEKMLGINTKTRANGETKLGAFLLEHMGKESQGEKNG